MKHIFLLIIPDYKSSNDFNNTSFWKWQIKKEFIEF